MMNIFVKKHLSVGYLMIAAVAIAFSCENDEAPSFDGAQATELQVADPYLQVQTPVIGFQAGTEKYDFGMNVVNGLKDINKVNVYSSFSDVTGEESNEVLLTSYDVTGPKRTIIADEFTYDELKAGLTVGGNPLPDDQTQLAVGAGWTLRFEGVRPDGTVVPLGGSVAVGVLHRFAGIYRVVSSEYQRIGVVTATWDGQTRFIGSVDENTFSYNDWWGNFQWTGESFHFDLDEATNKITAPIITESGLFGGNRRLNCEEDAGDFITDFCTGSNVVIPDDVTGKHIIKLTYGYFTTGSGPREFTEVLEKVVD